MVWQAQEVMSVISEGEVGVVLSPKAIREGKWAWFKA